MFKWLLVYDVYLKMIDKFMDNMYRFNDIWNCDDDKFFKDDEYCAGVWHNFVDLMSGFYGGVSLV